MKSESRQTNAQEKIRMGVSSCLLGHKVRFDGQHKKDPYIVHTLGQFFDFVPVCPEVECGLGIPREAMHLEGDPKQPRLVTVRTHIDLTERMETYARRRVEELAAMDLHGFIFKADSPSSGMERVKVYSQPGSSPSRNGVGIFARIFMERFPLLPVEEEGRLHDPKLREMFIEAVFTLRRWRDLRAQKPDAASLMTFHAQHKYLLMAHSPRLLAEAGRIVAQTTKKEFENSLDAYERTLVAALRVKTTTAKNVNVLMHMLGYFKKTLDDADRAELLELIEHYRQGFVPLVVPVTLIAHHVRRLDTPYLKDQVYLQPHPIELALRNHA